jgi:hypothetical protein
MASSERGLKPLPASTISHIPSGRQSLMILKQVVLPPYLTEPLLEMGIEPLVP